MKPNYQEAGDNQRSRINVSANKSGLKSVIKGRLSAATTVSSNQLRPRDAMKTILQRLGHRLL